MKIGFIGTGNMAGAIVQGIVAKNFVKGKDVYLFDVLTDKVKELAAQVDGNVCSSAGEVIEQADAIVLSVKPNIIQKVVEETKTVVLEKKPLLISIAAGTTLEKLEGLVGTSTLPIIRVMPNVNAMIGLGAAAVAGNQNASKEQVQYVIDLFNAVGKAWQVDEKDFSAYTALAGSSPAYAYLFIDSLARAGVKHGLTKDKALEYAAQAVLGSAKMIMESEENPWTLIDRVCSPGGTTVAGLLALEEEAFIATIVKGIDATVARDEEMKQL
ncbi:pyrroline-5-carboxylate reductase [Enterococcus termitis]|jgi:pyrroline-5-carboxylate reductase|uniref:Pyrroline-5-carboxylate reductase n=1 Tax=Enterococcus termitis TaxID=332950 RepID=A0A1E5GKC4_9ENTE|nr:pyrroline-5-carboxylate reductase [Enterococcus termitis]OEG13129.1 pyrroline-5-carboxylate reductase [Enterococcus termitis]OJG99008.1 pyrroline-5-carboxylate reductase [Enterococcus termitis]